MIRRKGPGLLGSLIGMLIGIGLVVIASPLLAWHSQSQDRAKEFSTAEVVSAESVMTGYVAVEGTAEAVDTIFCPRKGDAAIDLEIHDEPLSAPDLVDMVERSSCVVVETTREEYLATEKETCGDIDSNQTVIRQIEDQCDDNGLNCQRCYLVEETDWGKVGDDSDFARFKVGEYTVEPDGSAILIGSESFTDYVDPLAETDPIVGDARFKHRYLPLEQTMLVAGTAEADGTIEYADDKPFVLSTKNYDATLTDLKSLDRSTATMLAILSFLAMIIGMVLIIGPLKALTNLFNTVPILGKHVNAGFDAVFTFFAVLVGIVVWVLMFVIVVIVKKLLIAIIVLAVLGGIVFFLVEKGVIKRKREGAQDVKR